MREILCGALFLLMSACGGGEGPKAPTDGTRIAGVPDSATPAGAKAAPEAACAPGEPCAEPFAIAEVGFEIDVFERRPAATLPVDAKLDIGMTYGSVGTGPEAKSRALHFATVTYAGDIDVFDRDVAAPIRKAVTMPAGTWLAFGRKPNLRTREAAYQSFVLRVPFLVTSKDVVGARAVERESTVVDMNASAPKPPRTWTVEVTLADAAAARVAAWAETHPMHPLATVVHGRVVDEGHMAGRSKELRIDVGWVAPDHAPREAEKLAKELTERSAVR